MAAAGDVANAAAEKGIEGAKKLGGGLLGLGKGLVDYTIVKPVQLAGRHPFMTTAILSTSLIGGVALAGAVTNLAPTASFGLAGTTSLPFNGVAAGGAAITTPSAAATAAAPQTIMSTVGSTVTTGLGHIGNAGYFVGVNGWEIATTADWSAVGHALSGGEGLLTEEAAKLAADEAVKTALAEQAAAQGANLGGAAVETGAANYLPPAPN